MPTAFSSATSTDGQSRSRATLRIPLAWAAPSAIGQAEILGFYDPDRSRGLIRNGEPQAWSSLLTELADQRAALGQSHGEGFRILTGRTTSPTLARQIAALKQLYPALQWHRWEPMSRDAVRAGAILAYGQPVEVIPKLGAVDLLLTIDSDLLDAAPGHLRFARDFAARRKPDAHGSDEPSVRDRADADVDGRGGGSPFHRWFPRYGKDHTSAGRFGARRGATGRYARLVRAVGRGSEGNAAAAASSMPGRTSRRPCTPWSTR